LANENFAYEVYEALQVRNEINNIYSIDDLRSFIIDEDQENGIFVTSKLKKLPV
jgi:hypothetical protein